MISCGEALPGRSAELISFSSLTALKDVLVGSIRQSVKLLMFHPLTVYNVRKNYIESGLERAILRKKPDRVYERRLDGEGEAHLIALTYDEPPDGFERWSLRLLKDRLIRMDVVENISHETVRQTLKKTSSTLG